MVKVQRGEPLLNLQPNSKIVQEPNFTAKVDAVVEALSVSHIPTYRVDTEIDKAAQGIS